MRVWSIPEEGLSLESGLEPELSLETEERRLERVLFHPSADCLLSAAFGQTVRLWDILHQRQLYCEWPDLVTLSTEKSNE